MWISRLKAIRTSRFRALCDYIALAFCILIFLLTMPGFGGAATYTFILFHLIIPGYAFTRAFFPKLTILDKAVLIIAASIGMSAFTQSFLNVFISEMKTSTMFILDLLSLVLIIYAILRDAHHS